jgi:hypothetical protein
MAFGRYSHVVRMDSLKQWIFSNSEEGSDRWKLELFEASRHTNGGLDGKFSSSGRMLLTDECPNGIPPRPDGCKGSKLIDLNSAQSLLKAHN